MATTWLLPKFVNYQEGLLERLLEEVPEDFDYDGTLRVIVFVPIVNVLTAIPLLIWYVCENIDETNCGD